MYIYILRTYISHVDTQIYPYPYPYHFMHKISNSQVPKLNEYRTSSCTIPSYMHVHLVPERVFP